MLHQEAVSRGEHLLEEVVAEEEVLPSSEGGVEGVVEEAWSLFKGFSGFAMRCVPLSACKQLLLRHGIASEVDCMSRTGDLRVVFKYLMLSIMDACPRSSSRKASQLWLGLSHRTFNISRRNNMRVLQFNWSFYENHSSFQLCDDKFLNLRFLSASFASS